MAAATFQQLLLQTSTDDWREGRKVCSFTCVGLGTWHVRGCWLVRVRLRLDCRIAKPSGRTTYLQTTRRG